MHLRRVDIAVFLLAAGALIFCAADRKSLAQVHDSSTSNGRTVRALSPGALPEGFESYKDPQGTGQLIYVKSAKGPASAKAAMRQFLASLNRFFDTPLDIKAATGDPNDSVVQALLSSEIGGQPLEAVAAVATFQGNSIAGLIYDRSGSLRTSYPRLSSYFSKQIGEPSQTTEASAEPDLSTWTRRTGGDGSTNVLMPRNWQLDSIKEGSAILNGPNKEQVVLGYQTFVAPGNPGYAPYMPPEQALAWFLRNRGVQLVSISEREDKAKLNPGGQAELMMAEVSEQDGSRYKTACLVMTNPMGMNVWKFFVTYVAAPEDRFEAARPTMMGIWNNWKLDPAYVQEHLKHASETAAKTRAMIMEGAQRSMHAFDNVNEAIDQGIRGVSTMENTNTGKRAETQIGSERAVIDACRRNGTNCREVPDQRSSAVTPAGHGYRGRDLRRPPYTWGRQSVYLNRSLRMCSNRTDWFLG